MVLGGNRCLPLTKGIATRAARPTRATQQPAPDQRRGTQRRADTDAPGPRPGGGAERKERVPCLVLPGLVPRAPRQLPHTEVRGLRATMHLAVLKQPVKR